MKIWNYHIQIYQNLKFTQKNESMAYYTNEELKKLGLATIGDNVLISTKTSIYNPKKIRIGNNVRIDDFTIISAGKHGITIGNNVHIACYVSLIGDEKITLSDFVGLSSKVTIYSSTDDYSGDFLTGPTIPSEYKNVISNPIFLGKHVVIGSGSIILPGVSIGEGCAVGAMSLVNKNFEKFKIIVGIPAKIMKERNKNILQLENDYKKSYHLYERK